MKKALKIGAVAFGMYYAFNWGLIVGLANPIVDALTSERYDLATYHNRRITKMFKPFPLVAEVISNVAIDETNFILKMKKENRRVKYTKKN